MRTTAAILIVLSCLFSAAVEAQFQVVGPAPIPATAARQQIKALLEKVDATNSERTIKTLSALTPWYRDILDQELIAAWQRDDRTNLAPVIEPLADPHVAAGIVEFSWRQKREAAFLPDYAPMLGRLMERYPDSAKPFLDDLLTSAPAALNLSQPEIEAVCRILIDMPDVRTWRKSALQILFHYRQDAKNLLEKDLQSNDSDKTDRAARWLADLAAVDSAVGAQHASRAGSEISPPTLLTKVEPSYTEAARKLRVQGSVVLQVVVSADGTPRTVKLARSLGYGLDEKALEAVQQWRFNPSMKDGKPVAVLANLDVNFRLRDVEKGTTWSAGPMVFALTPGLAPPVVEDGTMPKPGSEPSDESVVLEFTVSAAGTATNIHAIHGSPSAAELLTGNLAGWKFRPAAISGSPVEAVGRVRFVKGQGDDAARAPVAPPVPEVKPSALERQALKNSAEIGLSEPKLLHRVEAGYSDAARAAGVKGVVVVQIVVDVDGNVVNPTVLTGLGLGLDEKAVEAVKQWKFTPAYENGKPVAVTKTVEITFDLR